MPGVDIAPSDGSLLIGTFFAIFFQGMLTVQAYVYYESFPNDPMKLKSLVALVWTIDLVHLIVICSGIYADLVTNWGNIEAIATTIEAFIIHILFVGVAAILCQGFFIYRVFVFSKKNWLLSGLLSLAALANLGLAVWLIVRLNRDRSVAALSTIGPTTIPMFSIGAGVDVAIAILMVYYLQQGRTGFARTDFVVKKIIQYVVSTSLATSLLALGSIVAYAINPNHSAYIAIHFSLGRMYTNALLATLNSRRQLRSHLGVTGDKDNGATAPGSHGQTVFAIGQSTAALRTSEYPMDHVGTNDAKTALP
ncbi:hypothetical protein GGX14DRAFT_570004 [Mycena pura]|uniref:DUF6534 domain-containing protein n=1 Tax=Mycena pura TaxID=153505 RepID=A0AAD6V654_9AGAR|nr:hypothetical protein GGX14DRAFT_570004 [Mycena pura]